MMYFLTVDGNRKAHTIYAPDTDALIRVAARYMGEEVDTIVDNGRVVMESRNHRAVARPIG